MTSAGSVITYPIPPYSNVPIRADYYQPSRFVLSGITRGRLTTAITTENHNYVVGQQVRFIIPGSFGIYQLNNRFGYVVSLPSTTQVEVDIDSSKMDAYIASAATTVAQILAIGDCNTGQTNADGPNTVTYIPGSFINISPL